MRWAMLLLAGGALAAAPPARADTMDHTIWDGLLKRHVQNGLVDYQALQAEHQALDQYLALLSAAHPEQLASREAKLAFWINAYNASVIASVLDHAPLKSVKDLRGFFDKIPHAVGGESLTLNGLEAKGRALGDWRIHFGVACASHSCPPLRSEAYTTERVNEQLDEQVKRFLLDPQRGLRLQGEALWLSKIFKWYAADFLANQPQKTLTAETIVPVIEPYLNPANAQAFRTPKLTLKFLDYDWLLNAQPGQEPQAIPAQSPH